LDWFYDSSCIRSTGLASSAGACGYSMPTTPGTYEFVLLAADGNTILATSKPITVTGSAAALSAASSSVGPGGQVAVSWSGLEAPTAADWIGLYATGSPNGAYRSFVYDDTCSGNHGSTALRSGSCALTMPATPGTYEFRLFANDGFTRIATSSTVTV